MAAAETTVREIALDQPASIRVFERLGIDYCCGGRKPLAQACAERSLDLRSVLAALENTETSKDASSSRSSPAVLISCWICGSSGRSAPCRATTFVANCPSRGISRRTYS